MARCLTSKLALMSDKPTWGEHTPTLACPIETGEFDLAVHDISWEHFGHRYLFRIECGSASSSVITMPLPTVEIGLRPIQRLSGRQAMIAQYV